MAHLLKNTINALLGFDPKTTYYATALKDCRLKNKLLIPPLENHQQKCYLVTFCEQGLNTISPFDTLDTFDTNAVSDTFFEMHMRGVDSRDGKSSNTGMYAPESHSEKGIGVHISATPTTFLGLCLHKNIHQAMAQGLIFEGDPDYLALLKQWFSDCRIDWAEIVATYMGDSFAHRMESLVHRFIPKSRQTLEDFCANLGEYAIDEGLITPAPLLDPFLEAVDSLRADLERLEAKMG